MRWNSLGFRPFGPDMLVGVKAFSFDPSVRPVAVSLSPRKAKSVAVLIGFAIFILIAAGAMALEPERRSWGVFAVFALLFFVPVAAFTVLSFLTRRSAVFDVAHVSVTETNGEQWQAKYKDFRGVRYRQFSRGPGTHATSSTFSIIELVHNDRAKTLPLFVDLGRMDEEERWAALDYYAAQFDVLVLPDQIPA